MLGLEKATNVEDPGSFSNRMRSRRFAMFERFIAPLPKPVRIVDLGGTNLFWERRGYAGRADVHVTTVNLDPDEQRYENVVSLKGDATAMPEFADKSFDVAFSNSVIEHLFTLDAQGAMAREVQRVAKAYWVQTPNYWFPVEPHFHMIGWQWLPRGVRVGLIRRRRCGWRGPCPELEKARLAVDEIRLMTRGELRRLFPTATIWPERVLGLVKSWVVHEGFSVS